MNLNTLHLNLFTLFTISITNLDLINSECAEKNRLAFDCTKSGYHKIPSNLPGDLKTVYLNKNSISILRQKDFEPYSQLEHLDLSDNQISFIEVDAFIRLYNLKSLYLSGNAIEHLDFVIPKSLEVLDVSKNVVTSIKSQFLNGTKIRNLDLSSNLLGKEALQNDVFAGIRTSSQLSIDLTNNNLVTVSNETVAPLLFKTSKTNRYEKLKLNLNSNNLHCNCLFQWVPNVLKMNVAKSRPLSIDIQGKCNSPNFLEYKDIVDVRESQMLCSAPVIVLPNKEGISEVFWTENEKGHLRCSASGDPTPTYSFSVENKMKISSTSSVKVNGRYSATQQGDLFVKDVDTSDGGNITCHAENVAGVTIHTFMVHVKPQLTKAHRILITIVILIVTSIILVLVISGVCLYIHHKRRFFSLDKCLWKRTSSSIGEESERISFHGRKPKNYPPFEHNHLSLFSNHRDAMKADSLDYTDNLTTLDGDKELNGDIHSAFVNATKRCLEDRRSRSGRSRVDEVNMTKSHPSIFDIHRSQFLPGSRDGLNSHDPMETFSYARKSNTMPKIAAINQGLSQGHSPVNRGVNPNLSSSQSNPGVLNAPNPGPDSTNSPLLLNGDHTDGALSRPSSTNSSNYSTQATHPYLSIKRGNAMPTVPAKLYAIPLYIDPPQYKTNADNSNVVSPGSTTSEATHMS